MRKQLKKTAILFGQANGFSAVMTALSSINLHNEGYDVPNPECRYVKIPEGKINASEDWGTANASLFWGATFPNYDFSKLKTGDLVVIVNIPIGEDRERFPDISFSSGIKKIAHLTRDQKIEVLIIDRHKNAVTAYGAAHKAANIIISSSASTTHYGIPNQQSLFWGRIGAISARDSGELPVTSMEEEMANALDVSVRKNPKETIAAIIRNDVRWFLQFNTGIPEAESAEPAKQTVKILKLTDQFGFKQLGAACEKFQKKYGVGVTGQPPKQRILVVTGWKTDALPAAFRLGDVDPKQDVKAFYDPHPYSKNRLDSIIAALDVPIQELSSLKGPASLQRSNTFYEDVAIFMRHVGKYGIPPYLTTHGWPHVENVLCHVRTLSSLFSLSGEDLYLLEWGALLHDIGRGAHMIYDGVESDEAQDHHEKYSARMIQEWFDAGTFGGLLTKDQKDNLIELCLAHRRISNLPDNPGQQRISIILRIADAMDVDKRRAQKNDRGQTHEELQRDPQMRKSSIPFWLGHRAIQSLRIHATPQKIHYELIITDPDAAIGTIKRFREEFDKMPGFSQSDIQEIVVSE